MLKWLKLVPFGSPIRGSGQTQKTLPWPFLNGPLISLFVDRYYFAIHRRTFAAFRVFVTWLFSHPSGSRMPAAEATAPALCRTLLPNHRNQKTFCTHPPPSQSKWFPLRGSRPFGAGNGATAFQAMELGRRRIPISLVVFPDPFLVPGGTPFIQTSVSHRNPFHP